MLVAIFLAGCSTRYRVPPPPEGAVPGEYNRHTRLVQAPADQIFAIVTNEAGFRSICPTGTVYAYVSAPPFGPGTTVRMFIDHIFKLTWHSRVLEVIPATRIRLTFLDGFFAGGTEIWDFTPEGPATRVTHTIVVQPEGLLRTIAWNLKVRLKHDIMVEQMLDNLKQAAEKPL